MKYARMNIELQGKPVATYYLYQNIEVTGDCATIHGSNMIVYIGDTGTIAALDLGSFKGMKILDDGRMADGEMLELLRLIRDTDKAVAILTIDGCVKIYGSKGVLSTLAQLEATERVYDQMGDVLEAI